MGIQGENVLSILRILPLFPKEFFFSKKIEKGPLSLLAEISNIFAQFHAIYRYFKLKFHS